MDDSERIAGQATTDGTARFAGRNRSSVDFYRDVLDLSLSSIGLGTYLGGLDEVADQGYVEAMTEAIRLGCNVIDTASNYRCQLSERSVGRALGALIEDGELSRDEIFVSTKGGFVAFDGLAPKDPSAWFGETWGHMVAPADLVAGCHVLSPEWIEAQIEQSLSNLGLETIDLYHLHNPETQLEAISVRELERRLPAVFEVLEEQVAAGRINSWGLATWSAFRETSGSARALSLERMVALASEVGGPGHGLRAVQLPLNVAMLEAATLPGQEVAGESMAALEAAHHLGLATFTSASIGQARPLGHLPEPLARLPHDTDAQRLLQFTRSVPGVSVSLVGSGRPDHARENFALAATAPLAPSVAADLVQRLV